MSERNRRERINENEKRTEIYGENKKHLINNIAKTLPTTTTTKTYTYYTITSLAAKNKLFITVCRIEQ